MKSEVFNRVPFKEMILSNERKKRGQRQVSAVETGANLPHDHAQHDAHEGAIDMEFTAAELREFLAADYVPTQADPAFKESLRKKLWTLVSHRHGPPSRK